MLIILNTWTPLTSDWTWIYVSLFYWNETKNNWICLQPIEVSPLITARIRRMGEGNIFSLCVSSHLDGRWGYPFPGLDGGCPISRSRWEVPPSQVQVGGGLGVTPFPDSGQGAGWGVPPSQVQAEVCGYSFPYLEGGATCPGQIPGFLVYLKIFAVKLKRNHSTLLLLITKLLSVYLLLLSTHYIIHFFFCFIFHWDSEYIENVILCKDCDVEVPDAVWKFVFQLQYDWLLKLKNPRAPRRRKKSTL